MAELWSRGTLGVEVVGATDGALRIEAYFPGGAVVPRELDALDHLAEVRLEAVETIPDDDWLATWRAEARPLEIGETLLVDPREPGEEGVPARSLGRTTLHLPARAAFGTGSHESTRLALELLEQLDLTGRRVLDVGTGTGILAFAALAWGARWTVGFDIDPAAPFHARDNGRRNGLEPALFAGTAAALAAPGTGRFDVLVVNIIPEHALPEIPALVPLLAPGAEAVVSGLLTERADEVVAALAAHGFSLRRERLAGEWAGLLLDRRSEPAPTA